jgi:hypothetical protein
MSWLFRKDLISDEIAARAEMKSAHDSERLAREAKAQEYRKGMQKFIDDDEADKAAARDFVPELKITQSKAATFIGYESDEFPVEFVDSIKCVSPGSGPMALSSNSISKRVDDFDGIDWDGSWYPYPAAKAQIRVSLFSGRTIDIFISRHKVDILYNALLRAWRENR